jgi:hypothetical protein
MGSIEYIESVFILQTGKPLNSCYCIIARTKHHLIFAAIPEYAKASIPEYAKFVESKREKNQNKILHIYSNQSLGLLDIPKTILEKYRKMDPEYILKETPRNFFIDLHDIKSVSYALIPKPSPFGSTPYAMTCFVPGDLTIEYGYKISIDTETEPIVAIIRYEENILDRLARLFGKKLAELPE